MFPDYEYKDPAVKEFEQKLLSKILNKPVKSAVDNQKIPDLVKNSLLDKLVKFDKNEKLDFK